jgi:hypothetical protein
VILEWLIKIWKDEITVKEAIKEPRFWIDLIIYSLVVVFMRLVATIIIKN